ncbi:MAG: GTPase HflX [Acidobacteriota bacterium]
MRRSPNPERATIAQPIVGHLRGLKTSQRKQLERIYRRKTHPSDAVSPELARSLASVSRTLNRQVGVLLGRDGGVRSVIVGDATRLELPDIGRLRGGHGRFRGLRLVHTHLRGESLTRDDLNDLALLRLDAVVMVEATADGDAGRVEIAMIDPAAIVDDGSADDEADAAGDPDDTGDSDAATVDALFRREAARDVFQLTLDFDHEIRALESEFGRLTRGAAGKLARERALIIAVHPSDARLIETRELVRAAGVTIAGVMRQKRMKVHPRTVVGRGKLQMIILEGMRRRADVAIFDLDLKPAQARAFEDATGLKAIDRTQLILDIFAQRARSRDGKLQVELAQLKYDLPRLTEQDAGLSRLTGGIGGRGPGETVMEIGRRRIRDRIRALERQIDNLSKQRAVRRRQRRSSDLPVLSIVGYTNAGKSTLLNALTNAEVAAADRLFMTLDPTSRRLRFPREGEVILTDTVGFLSDLPPDLVAAFRATLEELSDADLLLHVLDASDPELTRKHAAVDRLLDALADARVPRLIVLNKIDRLPPGEAEALARRLDAVAVSALARSGLDALIHAAEDALNAERPWMRPDGTGRTSGHEENFGQKKDAAR